VTSFCFPFKAFWWGGAEKVLLWSLFFFLEMCLVRVSFKYSTFSVLVDRCFFSSPYNT